jgi:hypothetical protein
VSCGCVGRARGGRSADVKSDATAEQLEELARFSPVFDTVSNGTDIDLQIEKT